MNEFEENIYNEIKNELVQSVIDKKIDTYFTNRNELAHYYNARKMIVNAQGGEEKAKYGNKLIKKFSERLTNELGKGYSITTLKYMRQFYLFQKGQQLADQSFLNISWSHIQQLLSIENIDEIEYYINQIHQNHWGRNLLREKIKSREYQRLSDNAKNKLIKKEELDIYDGIKNPILINTFDNNINKDNIEEKVLKSYILKDLDNFLEQLGDGFLYRKNEYKIIIGNKPNYIDLLLYNIIFNCYVVVELKVTESKKDHLGQIQVYMNYIDKHVKNINQNKTIGIIVCRKGDKYLILYSSDERIRITTYELV